MGRTSATSADTLPVRRDCGRWSRAGARVLLTEQERLAPVLRRVVHVLISPHYLNRSTLATYIAMVEGGLRDSATSKATDSGGFGGSIGWAGAGLRGTKESGTEDTLNVQDHDASRLKRLIDAGHDRPEELGWVTVSQPDVDFADVGMGATIEWECDTYIPEAVAVMGNHRGLGDAIHELQAMMPLADALGLDMSGLPETGQMETMATSLKQLDLSPVVVGEDSDTEWRLVGSLSKEWISDDATFDDRARVVGKVKKRVERDRWYPLASLPGMNLVGREERRRMEREGPEGPDEEDLFIQGPLLVVDYLAIFV